ncbi:MAG: hypothetical protein JWM81_9 [Candidatus Saccharibacteria bacterium]|nr:hypothetical protein [Candidatus Saccharibacteria bacterium]
MTVVKQTQEFSLCLFPEADWSNKLLAFRSQLADSPYRDDPPHMTLLRGITAPMPLDDTELIQAIQSITRIESTLPMVATVSDVANKSNHLYSSSSGLLLEPEAALTVFRRRLTSSLQEHGFFIEQAELDSFLAHITIRLGVPLHGELLAHAKDKFVGTTVNLTSWAIFRLELNDEARQMRQVQP